MRTLGKFETRREICLNDTKTVKMSTAAISLKVGDVAELWKIFSSAHTGVELVKMAAIIVVGDDVAEPHIIFSPSTVTSSVSSCPYRRELYAPHHI